MLTRRFTHGQRERKELEAKNMDQAMGSFSMFPDLILMDGGKGQVHIAQKVLMELGLDIPVCGMVKDDFHRTRGIYFDDEEIAIDRSSEAFHLVTRIQDEAHRFAIEYHRSLRSKTQVKSILEDIPGIGEARRKALMRYYGDIQKIREASVEDLKQVPSMNEAAAESVYAFFRKQPHLSLIHIFTIRPNIQRLVPSSRREPCLSDRREPVRPFWQRLWPERPMSRFIR